ncbi:MAG: hypothetical protein Q7T03_00570 [Deltaproteobacteria bacterium]|nr:hypothetical protein [Deltaproteobacteria bacterium]
MVKPNYIPSSPEQIRLAEALRLQKVASLAIEPGVEEDGRVFLLVEHEPDFLPGVCIDRYEIVRESNFISVKKEFCEGSSENGAKEETIASQNKGRWFSLQSLFIPDTGPLAGSYPAWVLIKQKIIPHQGDAVLWSFANPKADFLRKMLAVSGAAKEEWFLEGMVPPPIAEMQAWQSFSVFLDSIESPLEKIISKKEDQSALQSAAPVVSRWFSDSKTPPPAEKLNDLLKNTFQAVELKEILEEVKSAIFSLYPFVPEADLNQMAKLSTLWIFMRLLYKAAAEFQEGQLEQNGLSTIPVIPIDDNVRKRNPFYQQILADAVIDKNKSTLDIEQIRRGFQREWWARQGVRNYTTTLISPKSISLFARNSESQFDSEIAQPTFKNLLRLVKDPLVLERLHYLLGIPPGQELTEEELNKRDDKPFVWKRFNFPFAPPKEAMPDLKEMPDFVKEKIEETDGNERYLLTTPHAFELIEMAREKNRGDDGHKILLTLLALGETDYLQLELGAEQALWLAQKDFARKTIEATTVPSPVVAPPVLVEAESDPFYKKWWFWGAVVAVGVGGLVYGLSRKKENDSPAPSKPDDGNTPPDKTPPVVDTGRGTPDDFGL